jgi:hypothetical protein
MRRWLGLTLTRVVHHMSALITYIKANDTNRYSRPGPLYSNIAGPTSSQNHRCMCPVCPPISHSHLLLISLRCPFGLQLCLYEKMFKWSGNSGPLFFLGSSVSKTSQSKKTCSYLSQFNDFNLLSHSKSSVHSTLKKFDDIWVTQLF